MPAYTLTLTVSSDSTAEMAEVIDALGRSLAQPPAARIEPGTDRQDRVAWYRANARRFLDELTPDASRALMFVADRAPSVGIRTMSSALGLGTGPALAGKLASIGWAVRRLDAPPPFQRVRDRYEIEPAVAEALQGARYGDAVQSAPLRTVGRSRSQARERRSTRRVASTGQASAAR